MAHIWSLISSWHIVACQQMLTSFILLNKQAVFSLLRTFFLSEPASWLLINCPFIQEIFMILLWSKLFAWHRTSDIRSC